MKTDQPIFDYNDVEQKLDRESNATMSILFFIVLAAALLFIFFTSAQAQTIGDTQLGVQELQIEFANSYKTDTVVVVGQYAHIHFESPNLYDNPERSELAIVREWPGVEHVIFEDHDAIGELAGRPTDDWIVLKLHIGYNQIIRLSYGGVLSRRYFIISLRDVPNLDMTENGHVTEGDRILLGLSLGGKWPSRNYNPLCDFNNDGRVDDLDAVIFEQAKYWR